MAARSPCTLRPLKSCLGTRLIYAVQIMQAMGVASVNYKCCSIYVKMLPQLSGTGIPLDRERSVLVVDLPHR